MTVRPECQFEVHTACRIGEVRTVFGDLVFPARRCDCPCHKETTDEALPALHPSDQRPG